MESYSMYLVSVLSANKNTTHLPVLLLMVFAVSETDFQLREYFIYANKYVIYTNLLSCVITAAQPTA